MIPQFWNKCSSPPKPTCSCDCGMPTGLKQTWLADGFLWILTLFSVEKVRKELKIHNEVMNSILHNNMVSQSCFLKRRLSICSWAYAVCVHDNSQVFTTCHVYISICFTPQVDWSHVYVSHWPRFVMKAGTPRTLISTGRGSVCQQDLSHAQEYSLLPQIAQFIRDIFHHV